MKEGTVNGLVRKADLSGCSNWTCYKADLAPVKQKDSGSRKSTFA